MSHSTSSSSVQAPAEPSIQAERNALRSTDEAPEDDNLRPQQLHHVAGVATARLTHNMDDSVSDTMVAADVEEENDNDVVSNADGSVSDIMVVPDDEEDSDSDVASVTDGSVSDIMVASDDEEDSDSDVTSGTDGSVSDTRPAAEDEEDSDSDVVPNLCMYMRHELYILRGPIPPYPSAPAGLAGEADAVAAAGAVDAPLVGTTEEAVEPGSPVENGYPTLQR